MSYFYRSRFVTRAGNPAIRDPGEQLGLPDSVSPNQHHEVGQLAGIKGTDGSEGILEFQLQRCVPLDLRQCETLEDGPDRAPRLPTVCLGPALINLARFNVPGRRNSRSHARRGKDDGMNGTKPLSRVGGWRGAVRVRGVLRTLSRRCLVRCSSSTRSASGLSTARRPTSSSDSSAHATRRDRSS